MKPIELIFKLINTANPHLLDIYREDVCIFAPKYFIDLIKEENRKFYDFETNFTFAGYDIKIHPYNEIVIAHINFFGQVDETLINKIKL